VNGVVREKSAYWPWKVSSVCLSQALPWVHPARMLGVGMAAPEVPWLGYLSGPLIGLGCCAIKTDGALIGPIVESDEG